MLRVELLWAGLGTGAALAGLGSGSERWAGTVSMPVLACASLASCTRSEAGSRGADEEFGGGGDQSFFGGVSGAGCSGLSSRNPTTVKTAMHLHRHSSLRIETTRHGVMQLG